MKQEHELKQKLEQVLSPQLLELLRILQMPRLELQQMIRTEMEQNPFIDVEDDDENDDISENEESELPHEGEIDYDYFYHDDWKSPGSDFSRKSKDKEEFNPVDIYSAPVSFKQHILTQIHLQFSDPLDMAVAEFVTTSLSDDGFLSNEHNENEDDVDHLIMHMFDIDSERYEAILKRFRLLDPIGTGSRSIKECFLTQLEFMNMKDSLAYIVIRDFYDDFLKNKMYRIIAKLNISNDELGKAIDIIKKLNPKPANGEWGNSSNYVTPDVTVRRHNDEFIAELNNNNFPEIHLNRKYLELLQNRDKLSKKEEKFLKKRLNGAIFLVSGINKRNNTLMNITERIIQLQKEFFFFGVSALKPMVLNDIADHISVHESTVSRALENKYIDTPQGLFPFKFFFSRGISTENGETSSTNVKDIITKIIENENKSKPLTDQRIADILNEEYKISIARRTVAKYREMNGILPASKRKQYFKEVQ